jgi:hypothetical protein
MPSSRIARENMVLFVAKPHLERERLLCTLRENCVCVVCKIIDRLRKMGLGGRKVLCCKTKVGTRNGSAARLPDG